MYGGPTHLQRTTSGKSVSENCEINVYFFPVRLIGGMHLILGKALNLVI